MEKFAIRPLTVPPGRAQMQKRTALKSDDFLDIPPMTAHHDGVAGGKS
jgi:hypothetical protein